ncbi:MAG: undecaprenyldiphospho-muramoylpentapeptide beta-N-acetylglucosaminyltransferase [Acidobacteriota bacterium]
MKRAIVTTGGTGGHIFPALAVAAELRAMHPGLELLFVGGEGPEGRLARDADIEFRGLPVRGVLGRGLHAIPAMMRMGMSLVSALGIVRGFNPEVVAGFGGYAGFCPVLAAWMLGVPTAVHEQNSIPGATNRILGRLAERVLVTYPDDTGAFPARKVVLTGNPVRPEISRVAGTESSRVVPKRILVLGGSQGAKAVNRMMVTAWPRLAASGLELWHQTGPMDYESVSHLYRNEQNVRVEPFISNMAEAYAWADVVIGRAGASTLAELACAGKPSVLVPFPHATHDHQSVNASYLERAGAAVVIPEKQLNVQVLTDTVLGLLGDADKLSEMGRAARSQARPQAARAIAEELTRLAA